MLGEPATVLASRHPSGQVAKGGFQAEEQKHCSGAFQLRLPVRAALVLRWEQAVVEAREEDADSRVRVPASPPLSARTAVGAEWFTVLMVACKPTFQRY